MVEFASWPSATANQTQLPTTTDSIATSLFFCLVFFHSFDPISQLLELKRAYDNGQILHPYKHLETQRVGTPSQISGLFRDTKKID